MGRYITKLGILHTFDTCIGYKDEEVDRTEGDTLNGFPPMKLTLNPGGCAFYQLPTKPGEVNIYIQPAKKQGSFYWVRKTSSCFCT